MVALSRIGTHAELVPGCTRATVLAHHDGALALRLADGAEVTARGVMGLALEPRAGDVVLCVAALAGVDRVEHYVIAVVAALRPAPTSAPLTVERDEVSGRSVVKLPRGAVRFEADGDLELSSTSAVRVEGERIVAEARTAEVTLDAAVLRARRWDTFASVAKHTAGVLETQATRIVTRAKNAYQEVESLAQLNAGRVRLAARDALHMHARRALVKADEDVKLKGEKIHLG